ncbi:MAG: YfhO family protein [Chloroflexi bacterium]|nr:YfhO family protein [Chloroflexota bacterium]
MNASSQGPPLHAGAEATSASTDGPPIAEDETADALPFVPERILEWARRPRVITAGAIGLLLFLTLLYFWPFVLRGEVIAPTDLLLRYYPWSSVAPEDFTLKDIKNIVRGDVVDGRLPALSYFRDSIRGGDIPLWTPIWSQGRPFASQMLRAFYHPVNALPIIFPLAEGFSLSIMAKLFLSGLFMYLFLRRLGLGNAASVLGGIAYMFSGFNIVWLMWRHTLVSSVAPLLFLQTENLVRKPTPLNSALLSIVVAVMVLGGFPAVAAYFFYAVGLYFVVRVVHIYFQERSLPRAAWTVGGFCLGFGLAAGLTAFVLLPSLEFANFVDISRQRKGISSAAIPIKHAYQLFFPNFYGNQVFGNGQRGWGNLNETSAYIGIATIFIAMTGIVASVRRRDVTGIFFGVLALMAFMVVYRDTGPLRSFVRQLPIFDLNPNTRMLSVMGFALSAAAAFGLEELLRVRLNGWSRRLASLAMLAGAAGLGLLAAMLLYRMDGRRALLSDFFDDFPFLDIHALANLDYESFRIATTAFGILVLMLFALLLAAHFARAIPTALVTAGILALVITDLFVFAYRQNPTTSEAYFYPELPSVEFLQANIRPYERVAPFDNTFNPGAQAFYGFSSAFSHTYYSGRHRELVLSFSQGAFQSITSLVPKSQRTDFGSPIIDLLGVRYLTFWPGYNLNALHAETAPGKYRKVYDNPGELTIFENTAFSPAFLVSDVHVGEPEQVLEGLTSPGFDPHTIAYVEKAPPGGWEPGPATASSVRVVRYHSDSVVYRVKTDSDALLVTPELYYPGWKAYVDGERVDVYRADYIFRGAFLDAGEHEVKFVYRPPLLRAGVIISLIAAAAVLAILIGTAVWRFRLSRAGGREPAAPETGGG